MSICIATHLLWWRPGKHISLSLESRNHSRRRSV